MSGFAMYEALGSDSRKTFYRPTKPLTYELGNHSKVYLEDGQYSKGFTFLNALLTSHTSVSTPSRPYPAYLAPAPQLAVASTLIAYPAITTKARSDDRQKDADAALQYLRNVYATVDPLTADFMNAFAFPDDRSRRRTGGYRGTDSGTPSSDHGKQDHLSCAAANVQALWTRADDFWHIVGWAFNCSVSYKNRWERWKLWLNIMLDLIEAEWEARLKLCEDDGNKEKTLMKSLLWKYIASQDPSNRPHRRRIINAVFSQSTPESRKEFPEIWRNETAGPKAEGTKLPTKVDIENDEFGDYDKDDEDEAMEDVAEYSKTRSARTAISRRTPERWHSSSPPRADNDLIPNAEEAVERLGGIDAVQLRQRIIALLLQVAAALPKAFTRLEDLMDTIQSEHLRYLPIMMFQVMLSTSALTPTEQIGFNANLIVPIVSGSLPNYTAAASQKNMEDCYLPCAAATQSFATNAKVTLALEQMLMNMAAIDSLRATVQLRKSLAAGIATREKVYGTARGKKSNPQEEEQARIIMIECHERLLGLLEVLEISAGKKPQPPRAKSQSFQFSSSFSSAITLSSLPDSDTEEEKEEGEAR